MTATFIKQMLAKNDFKQQAREYRKRRASQLIFDKQVRVNFYLPPKDNHRVADF